MPRALADRVGQAVHGGEAGALGASVMRGVCGRKPLPFVDDVPSSSCLDSSPTPSIDVPLEVPLSAVRLGALCWNQYTDWPSLLEAGQRADRARATTPSGRGTTSIRSSASHEGPIFEGWLTLAAWAQATERVRIGLMVGANTFREPALTAKMATTLDHISNGRAILGIGGAWFETEHEAYGLAFGDGFPERLRWLGEALPIMRGMLHGERPTAAGPRYAAKARAQRPAADPGAPAAAHRRRRRAGHAQARRPLRRRQQRRRRASRTSGARRRSSSSTARRSGATRPRSSGRPVSARSSSATRGPRRERVQREIFDRNGNAEAWKDQPVGTPEDVAERIAPYLELGYRHLIAGFPSPYDEESMTRLATEVRADARAAG